ncbi:hypothetical protein SCHPADRAFT_909563 [Schizopora paradoxa]|uniref:Uncharacterized protein n=1 Tax=Schizopora paradoxa TaxID=27342 RepID=A0A0H2R6C4_9AGAM|nr:hypothetical protein SCHPADRAFT_909563 [Schizopora paradoxa]
MIRRTGRRLTILINGICIQLCDVDCEVLESVLAIIHEPSFTSSLSSFRPVNSHLHRPVVVVARIKIPTID